MIGSDRRIPIAPITIPPAARLLIERLPAVVWARRLAIARPLCSRLQYQVMNISQPEHGENGESVVVVNQSLRYPSFYGTVLAIMLLKIIINF
jgi:hypothetical protein